MADMTGISLSIISEMLSKPMALFGGHVRGSTDVAPASAFYSPYLHSHCMGYRPEHQ